MSKPRIAFLGLGTMGAGMANRLADAGYPLAVYNRNPDRTKSLAHAGKETGLPNRRALPRKMRIL